MPSLPLTALIVSIALAPFARAVDVTFTIDPSLAGTPISPWIYGANPGQPAGTANPGLNQPAYKDLNLTMERIGGNRWSAYNWTTNASNAGTDYRLSNDAYLSNSTTPGDAVHSALDDAAKRDALAVITVPMAGYVAADKSGPVPAKVDPAASTRFLPSFPTRAADPHPAANHVYQDGFVQWVKANYADGLAARTAHRIAFSLDNEPDLWKPTHPEIHPAAVTYAELIQRTTDYARMIKTVAPGALISAPASYGWTGFRTLQSATDSSANNAATDPHTGKPYGDFISFYLAAMHAAEAPAGVRLVDWLDVHWYPEAQGDNAQGAPTRIMEQDASPGVAAARMHAPRSLWDPDYIEKSWITKSLGGKPIALIPRLEAEISANYPGTKLAITEYNYGGGGDISGGVAEADVLGILGRYGVYAAAEWPLARDEPFIHGAMRMYRNFDNHNGAFGDTTVSTTAAGKTTDTSLYASTDSTGSGRLVLVAINASTNDLTAAINLRHPPKTYATFKLYQLTHASAIGPDGSATPIYVGSFPIADLAHFTLPAESVNTIVLTPAP